MKFQLNNNLIGILISTGELFFTFMLLLISCEVGSGMSSAFENINDQIDELDWYLLPIKMQVMLPFIMINVQESIGMPCFGSIMCERDTFKSVRDTKLSEMNQSLSLTFLLSFI